jgi:predicted nucleotidyltransferase
MRISSHQANIICTTLCQYFGASTAVWLFGSRVDDHKRGGDIDLYIETDLEKVDAIVDARLYALAAIKLKLGDQKIDLVIHRRGQPMEPIHLEAKKTGVRL